jgi:hypothetical protein
MKYVLSLLLSVFLLAGLPKTINPEQNTKALICTYNHTPKRVRRVIYD